MSTYTTRSKLLAMSNIPNTPENPVFDQLCEAVRLHIRDEPENSFGIAGPRRGGRNFFSWVEEYLDSGLGQHYWGSDVQGVWRIDRDRASILRFFSMFVTYFARYERGIRAPKRPKGARSESPDEDEWEEQLENEEEEEEEEEEEGTGSEDLNDNELYPLAAKASTQEDEIGAGANSTKQDFSVPPNFPSLLSSVRKYALEGTPSPPSKRLRQLGSVLRDVMGRPSAATSSDSTLLHESDNNQIFETRLGYDKAVAFLFAPRAISFQDFFDRFCGIWRKDSEETDVEDVEVRVDITGVGEYQLSFGSDRGRSWLQIMKIVKERPGSSILVTVAFDQCASYCEKIAMIK